MDNHAYVALTPERAAILAAAEATKHAPIYTATADELAALVLETAPRDSAAYQLAEAFQAAEDPEDVADRAWQAGYEDGRMDALGEGRSEAADTIRGRLEAWTDEHGLGAPAEGLVDDILAALLEVEQ